MDDGSPALEVGFAIDMGNAFDDLAHLQREMNTTEAKVAAEAARIERATSGMLDIGRATAGIRTFGSAATKEAQNAARELARVEKAGESLSRQLERQASTFGKTREEIRAMKVGAAALAAEQQGLSELASRLRAQEAELSAAELKASQDARAEAELAARVKREAADAAIAAAEQEAAAVKRAADGYRIFEAVAKQKSAAYRQSQLETAAEAREAENLAAAAVRLRASIDPAFAAQNRFDTEMANAKRLISAGAIGLDDYAAKLRIERALLDEASDAHQRGGRAVGSNSAALAGLSFQAQDAFTQISMGTNVLSVLAIQGGQAAGQMIYMEGKLGSVARFLIGPWGLAITGGLLVLGALTKGMFDNEEAAKAAEAGMKKFQDRQSDIGNFIDDTTGRLKEQNKTLILNAILARQAQIAANDKEVADSRRKAFDRAGQAALRATQAAPGTTTSGVSFTDDVDVQRVIKAAGNDTGKLAEGLAALAKTRPALAKVALDVSSIGGQAILAQRDNERLNKELRGLAGDTKAFANSSVEAVKRQAALAAATTPLEKAKAQLAIVEAEGAAAVKAGGAAVDQYKQKLVGATLAVKAAEEAQKKQTAANRAAAAAGRREENLQEKLAREAAATEAQTRNLYGLAAAYQESGGAALIAEARVKAESQAIKERGDIDAFVARQVDLAIAQRVADAAKTTAALRDQADVQEQVNAAVAAGTVPAAEAAQIVRDRLADLPLLTALEAKRVQGDVAGAIAVGLALDQQRAARERLTQAEGRARFSAAVQSGTDRLAELREELRLIGATDEARARGLAEFRAQQDAASMKGIKPEDVAAYVKLQGDIAVQTERNRSAQDAYNDSLTFAADKWDLIARNVQRAGQGMADAFGAAGRAIGDLATIYAGFQADRARLDAQHDAQLKRWHGNEAQIARENQKYAIQTSALQIGAYGDAAAAAKSFFSEGSAGYQTLAAAEKAFRAVEFALSVRAMAQDAAETVSAIAKSGARAAAHGVEAVAKAIASLPFPLNIAAGAATAAVIASLGIAIGGAFGGSGPKQAPSNTGTGTVLGDASAKSESVKRAIDELKAVDTLTNVYSRQMLASLKSIDSQISGVASVIVRGGDINASANVAQGFKPNLIGSILGSIPLIGGLLGGLFGTRTDVTGSGIYGGPQTIGSINAGGFNGQAYSDITRTKKFLGIVSGRSYSTEYGALDPNLSNQFTLILRSFNDAIKAAAVPLGESTDAIQAKLNGFVVNIGKIDLKGLTGEQIQEKLNAVFGAAADNMATAAFPLISQFQKVGEGAFETLVRVASTVEQVSTSLDLLGTSAKGMSVAAKLGLADQFDSVSALNDAATAYFQAFYTSEEQAAAKTAQMGKVFASLGLAVPSTLASFRQLVEAQDLTTAAGQATYATLLKLAPAFADLQQSLQGAKSAADILSERQDLERQILELQGKTDEIRKLDLAKLDASNRALQLQVWAIQDAQEAAKAADELRQAWSSVGDSIMDEVKRIRGLGDVTGSNTFASLLGQFNAATIAARGGDQDAAKSLPQLSQALLAAASNAATSRQELARVQAQTAASLEVTYGAINKLGTAATATSNTALLAAAATAQTATAGSNDNTATIADLRSELAALTDEVKQLRNDNNAGHAATAANTGKAAKALTTAQDAAGGVAIGTKAVA
jgi:hypothetical protein